VDRPERVARGVAWQSITWLGLLVPPRRLRSLECSALRPAAQISAQVAAVVSDLMAVAKPNGDMVRARVVGRFLRVASCVALAAVGTEWLAPAAVSAAWLSRQPDPAEIASLGGPYGDGCASGGESGHQVEPDPITHQPAGAAAQVMGSALTLPGEQTVILNLSVVGNFSEPPAWPAVCGPGALRVLLAFAGMDTSWKAGEYTGYGVTNYDDTGSWTVQGTWDAHGRDYMMYLALGVNPPTWGSPGHQKHASPGVMSLIGRHATADYRDLACVADWETKWGGLWAWDSSKGKHPFSCADPFEGVDATTVSQATFQRDIETEIGRYGVPALVAATEVLTTKAGTWALPSQVDTTSVNIGHHWISIVGYDSRYYYYVDTCPRFQTHCGGSPYAAGTYAGPPYAGAFTDRRGRFWDFSWRADPAQPMYKYAWRISKSDLWQVVNSYIRDSGGWKVVTAGGR
jgi:hypothetical protein